MWSYPEFGVKISVAHRASLLHVLALNGDDEEEEEEGEEEERPQRAPNKPTHHS